MGLWYHCCPGNGANTLCGGTRTPGLSDFLSLADKTQTGGGRGGKNNNKPKMAGNPTTEVLLLYSTRVQCWHTNVVTAGLNLCPRSLSPYARGVLQYQPMRLKWKGHTIARRNVLFTTSRDNNGVSY